MCSSILPLAGIIFASATAIAVAAQAPAPNLDAWRARPQCARPGTAPTALAWLRRFPTSLASSKPTARRNCAR
jgi:hypothetical protein